MPNLLRENSLNNNRILLKAHSSALGGKLGMFLDHDDLIK